ncbi:MAG: endonuclease MutS2 [Clostridiales Family XIII bacterium]|nr:endonuclease MutS2 [Clostridiales Family XIII bacterium]
MSKREFRLLEYDKIKAMLADEASSALTKDVAAELAPLASAHVIRQKLAETTEAVAVIMRKGSLPLGDFPDVKNSARYAEIGGVLTMRQLLDVGRSLTAARKAAHFLQNDLPGLDVIAGLRDVIAVHKSLETRIEFCIVSENEMADSASSELSRIRRNMTRQNEAIRAKLSHLITTSENKGLLQEGIVTLRQGRYVLPVKQEHKTKFPGMIHDQSATGATLFIEPQAVVNMNNELREMELAEAREIERILAELSSEVAEAASDLANNQEILVKLDFIFAKGKLSVKQKASEARINTARVLHIKNGRHPLIPADKAVPISLSLGGDYRTLIITGPNTGGKTVTLKMAGLFLLMTESGLHVPADEGTEMPVMERVFADIGDEQSIEQSLSTFSSHMTNIVEITARCNEKSLVLLDELGAGTDPTEGAALATAILENLMASGAMTIATTHYAELKKFAIATEGVENASMEFNVETLSPTYRLRMGLPGRSNAFEISRKLGLPEAITARAATFIDTADIRFESVIRSIETDRKAAEDELDEAAALKLGMKRQQESLEQEKHRLEEKKAAILTAAREEAAGMIHEAKELADEMHKELRALPLMADEGERNRRLEAGRKRLQEMDRRYRTRAETPVNLNPVDPAALRPGDRVKVLSLEQNGEIISPADEKGEVQVQVGRMKINVSATGLARIQGGKKEKKAASASFGALYSGKVQSISPSISVRGENLDSAMADVEKYLDDAYIAGLHEVTIIHGKGEGILREGLRDMLKSHGLVKSFRGGAYNEGGDGITVCAMKEK